MRAFKLSSSSHTPVLVDLQVPTQCVVSPTQNLHPHATRAPALFSLVATYFEGRDFFALFFMSFCLLEKFPG